MNASLFRLGKALLLCSLLAACGTTPQSKYYLLTSKMDGIPAGDSPQLGIGPVIIPEYLDRDTLVYRESSNELHINSAERWAEPLEDGISRVMVLNLAAQLDTVNVHAFPFHAQRRPDWGVKLRLVRLDAENNRAILDTEWLIYTPGSGEAIQQGLVSLERELDPEQAVAPQLAGAYSELLWQLSEEIATEIRRHTAPTE